MKRWLALILTLLVAMAVVCFVVWPPNEYLRRYQQVRVGMPIAEAREILGNPTHPDGFGDGALVEPFGRKEAWQTWTFRGEWLETRITVFFEMDENGYHVTSKQIDFHPPP